MSRRGFGSTMRMIAREAARAERSRQHAKEATRLHVTSQMEESEDLTIAVRERDEAISSLLARALTTNPAIDLKATLTVFRAARFDESRWNLLSPEETHFAPEPPGFFARMVPGAARRHERRVTDGKFRFRTATESYHRQCRDRDAAFQAFEANEASRRAEDDRHNAAVNDMQRGLGLAEHAAVVGYYKLVVERSLRGEPDAVTSEIGYSPDSRHLVVDLELPEFSAVPEESSFRYIKSVDRIEPVERPIAKRKAQYAALLSQVTLKCVDTIFRGGPAGVVECLTVNGMLDAIDPATGQHVRVCLLSVRVTADVFQSLNLAQVHPEHCLRSLKASVSRAPAELLPVKPLVELDMVDPRFVDTMDVMSGLDHRPNLMELTPTEFEGLITNLFAAMGLDTRQTRPSRDGGVDCVAFDPRPVFGGKVVIQAKRYKNTVGVSAVRDLFGTVQNEGASKGILVTTSGYGKAAFEFARGKPLELLDGGNLLHLLSEHAAVEARIIMPDGWVDLPVHGE
jgi:restriction system protein